MCLTRFMVKVSVVIGLITYLFLGVITSAEPVVIRFAHSASPESPKGQMALKFQQLVKEALGNESVVVEVYPRGMLFDDKQILPAVIKNRAQIVVTPISSLQEFSDRFKLFDLPFLFVSERAASRFLKGEFGDRLLRLIGRQGVVGLGYLNDGMKQLSSVQKILIPDDAKNIKFLTSGSDVADTLFRQVGARPVVGNLNKTVTFLQNKVVDGQDSTWSNIRTRGIHEYQPFILESNHVYLADVILASREGWSSIPNDMLSVVKTQLDKAIEYGNALAERQATSEKKFIMESGNTEVIAMTVDQREQWVAAMEGVWKKFENEVGADLINAAASAR